MNHTATDPREFDPATVPAYPVYTIVVDENGTVTVDGLPVEAADGADPAAAARARVAELAKAERLAAVRVQATGPDGVTHRMVITQDGTAHELPDPVVPRRKLGARGLIIAGVATAAVIGLTAGTTHAVRDALAPEPVAAPTVTTAPGAGAQLPVLAPPGFAQTASWSVQVRKGSTPAMLPDGRVLVVTPDGKLNLLDPDTAEVLWRGSSAPRNGAQIAYSTIAGRDVVATASTRELKVWPLDLDTRQTSPVAYELPKGTEVSFLGTSPMVTLPDQTVGIVGADGLTRADVPVTATPVLAAGDQVIAVDETHWYRISRQETTASELPRPEGAETIRTVSAAGVDHLIIVWTTDDPGEEVVGLIDLQQGTLVVARTVAASTVGDRDVPVKDPAGTTLTVGGVFVDAGADPAIVPIGRMTVSAVTGTTVYGTESRAAVVVDAAAATVEPRPFTDKPIPQEPVAPAIATASTVWVTASKVEATYLYALPTTENEGASNR
ncbi:hypothetical protein [Agromyces sp. NPDC058126]|uniref:hypothetical protein n=1 Tax=Agromyces sp. NPDC058126 TaxID=3346350 RepID=UPI0036D8A7C0